MNTISNSPALAALGAEAAIFNVPTIRRAAVALLQRIEAQKLTVLRLEDLEAVAAGPDDLDNVRMAVNVLSSRSVMHPIGRPEQPVTAFVALRDPEAHAIYWDLRPQLPTAAAITDAYGALRGRGGAPR